MKNKLCLALFLIFGLTVFSACANNYQAKEVTVDFENIKFVFEKYDSFENEIEISTSYPPISERLKAKLQEKLPEITFPKENTAFFLNNKKINITEAAAYKDKAKLEASAAAAIKAFEMKPKGESRLHKVHLKNKDAEVCGITYALVPTYKGVQIGSYGSSVHIVGEEIYQLNFSVGEIKVKETGKKLELLSEQKIAEICVKELKSSGHNHYFTEKNLRVTPYYLKETDSGFRPSWLVMENYGEENIAIIDAVTGEVYYYYRKPAQTGIEG